MPTQSDDKMQTYQTCLFVDELECQTWCEGFNFSLEFVGLVCFNRVIVFMDCPPIRGTNISPRENSKVII